MMNWTLSDILRQRFFLIMLLMRVYRIRGDRCMFEKRVCVCARVEPDGL